jgi:inosose dehydratase
MVMSRRQLLAGLSSSLAIASSFARLLASSDASRPEREAIGAAAAMRFGYAAITWGAAIGQAIDDIAAVGFRGIQLRIEAFQQYGDRPAALEDLLQQRGLAFAVLSSGNLSIDPAREAEELATHVRHAQFVRAAGGQLLQIIDERPKGREIVPEDYRRLGRLLTTLGQRTADIGVPLVYHHHMNSLGERPNEVAAVLEAADPKHVRLLFDVAHYQQGGGDPVAAIKRYGSWIDVVHLKDVVAQPSGSGYQFVELGRGRVDLPGVFAALDAIGFSGWSIVELDRVPEPGRTPKESAEINRRYLVERAHRTI